MTGKVSQVRKTGATLGLALIALAASGCGTSNTTYYQPVMLALVAPPGAIVGDKLPIPEVVPPVHIRVLGRGGAAPDAKGATAETFRVRFAVSNVGQKPMTVDPTKAYLINDAGTEIAAGEVWSANQKVDRVTVKPGESSEFHLAFQLPATVALKDLKKLSVRWPYAYGDQAFIGAAQFALIDPNALNMPSDYGNPNDKMSPYVEWSGTVGPVAPNYSYGGWGGGGRRW